MKQKVSSRDNSVPQSSPTSQAQETVKYVTVQCKGCGATNKIVSGTVGECEFCGSQISEDSSER